MRLKLFLCSVLIILMFPFQANALTPLTPNSTTSADTMRLKIDELKELRRERKQETRELMQEKKDKLRLSLQAFRDQKKRIIVERIDTRMANINKKTTIRLSSVLDKIQSILNKFISNSGTPALDSATASAQLAINNAKDIVASQSAMVYVMQIASESAVKENVGSTVSELRLDLRDAHKAVVDAKQAVMNAVKEHAKLKRSESAATSSAQ